MKLKAIIVSGNYGTYDVNLEYSDKVSFGLFGTGKSIEDAIADFHNSHQEMKEYYVAIDKMFPANLDFEFKYEDVS